MLWPKSKNPTLLADYQAEAVESLLEPREAIAEHLQIVLDVTLATPGRPFVAAVHEVAK